MQLWLFLVDGLAGVHLPFRTAVAELRTASAELEPGIIVIFEYFIFRENSEAIPGRKHRLK